MSVVFVAWACGHAHQHDASGVMSPPLCGLPAWYLTGVRTDFDMHKLDDITVLPSDVLLHVLEASTRTYHPARWADTVLPEDALLWCRANRRRLLVNEGARYRVGAD